jgi:hypothetical protein
MLFGPVAQRLEWGMQSVSQRGQFVFDPGWDLGVHVPGDKSVAFRVPERFGEDFRAHAVAAEGRPAAGSRDRSATDRPADDLLRGLPSTTSVSTPSARPASCSSQERLSPSSGTVGARFGGRAVPQPVALILAGEPNGGDPFGGGAAR